MEISYRTFDDIICVTSVDTTCWAYVDIIYGQLYT